MKTTRFSALLVLSAFLSCLMIPAAAQAAEARISKAISDDSRTTLPASSIPWATKSSDLGAVSPEMQVPGITIVFSRSTAQEADLQTLLAAQQNPKSPQYRQWLTPDAFATRFGMSADDIAQVESWLTAHGFHVDSVARSRDRISFSGTAAQVESAFGTSLHHYRLDGAVHFAPSSALSLPSALAPVTAAVLHLSDLRPKSNVHAIAKPQFTSGTTGAHYLAPGDVATMYDLAGLSNQGMNGTGQSLAIVGQSYVDLSVGNSIATFEGTFGGSGAITPILVPGSGSEAISEGDLGESQIDLEYSASLATKANIFLVYVGSATNYSVFDSLALAITEDIAPVISISYGSCEPLMSATDLDQYNSLFEQASSQGQTIVASSGDSGSTACAPYTTAEGVTTAEQESLSVNFPASSPYVTAVGGTQMAAGTYTAGSSDGYWDSSQVIDGGDELSSLLSYVPEVAWNEGSATNGILAGGGGTSSHFARPAWQESFAGMPAGTYRLLPDIALQASVESPGYLLCTSDPELLGEEGQVSSCSQGMKGSNDEYTTAGGTSFAAPIFAGYLAVLNQYANTNGLGNVNPMLYQLASNTSTYNTAFHDITSGSIACLAAASGCAAADQSSYAAAVGYDEATGLGSLDFSALATTWPTQSPTSLTATSITIAGPDTSVSAADNVSLDIQVQNSTGTSAAAPTGTVSVAVDGVVANASITITPETLTDISDSSFSFAAPSTTGSHLVIVTYSGDSAHAASTGTLVVNVGNPLASGGISLSATTTTVANNSVGTSTVTITPTGGYNGRLTWKFSITALNAAASDITGCYGIASPAVNGVTTTTLELGFGTACSSATSNARAALKPFTVHRFISSNTPPQQRKTRATILWTGASLCLLGCGCLGRRRRNWPLMAALFLILPILGLGLGGCGGSNSTTTSSTTSGGSTSSSNEASFSATLTGTDSVNDTITASTTFYFGVD